MNSRALVVALALGDLRFVDPNSGEEVVLLSDPKPKDDTFRIRDSDGAVLLLVEDGENGLQIRMLLDE